MESESLRPDALIRGIVRRLPDDIMQRCRPSAKVVGTPLGGVGSSQVLVVGTLAHFSPYGSMEPQACSPESP